MRDSERLGHAACPIHGSKCIVFQERLAGIRARKRKWQRRNGKRQEREAEAKARGQWGIDESGDCGWMKWDGE